MVPLTIYRTGDPGDQMGLPGAQRGRLRVPRGSIGMFGDYKANKDDLF